MPKLPITDVLKIYQFKRTGDTEQYGVAPTYECVNACISPTGTDIQNSGDVAAFQLFEVFLYDTTLELHNADKFVNQQNVEYIVAGVPYVINIPFLSYIRCLVRQVV